MEPRVHYVVVGIFVLLLGSTAVGLSLWLAFGRMAYETDTYQVYMTDSVSGLFIDAPVKYSGVQVGRVRDMGLDPDIPEQVRLTLDIDSNVRIKEDTIATLTLQGLTGIASIDLSGGSRESPELAVRPGERYPVIQAGPSLMTRVDAAMTELMENLNRVARDLHQLLAPDTRERLDHIVRNVEVLTATLAERRVVLGEGIDALAEFSDHAATAGAQLPALLGRVDQAVTRLHALAEEFAMTNRDAQAQLQAGGDSLRGLGGRTLPEVDSLLVEMRQLTGSFQRLSDRLEEDPRALLFGPQLDPPGPGE